MNRTLCTFICLVVVIALPAAGSAQQDYDTLFDKANSAYSQGEFNQAAEVYQQLLYERGYSVGVLYNLANSYAGNGEVGKAVLNYERAHMLQPGDSDILGNLQLVRTGTGLFDTRPTLADRLSGALTMNQWTALGGCGLTILAATLLIGLYYPLSTRLCVLTGACCLLAISLSIYGTATTYRDWQASIIISPEQRLLISPFDGATAVGDIVAGRKVFIRQYHGKYVFIEDTTGRTGWLPQDAVESVLPDGP